jgi:hypothetical protein
LILCAIRITRTKNRKKVQDGKVIGSLLQKPTLPLHTLVALHEDSNPPQVVVVIVVVIVVVVVVIVVMVQLPGLVCSPFHIFQDIDLSLWQYSYNSLAYLVIICK